MLIFSLFNSRLPCLKRIMLPFLRMPAGFNIPVPNPDPNPDSNLKPIPNLNPNPNMNPNPNLNPNPNPNPKFNPIPNFKHNQIHLHHHHHHHPYSQQNPIPNCDLILPQQTKTRDCFSVLNP